MTSQKGLAPILIVLLIAVAIGGYLVYSGKINLPQKTSQISNWQIYKDEENKFSLKYPNDWKYETKSYDGGGGNYIRFSQDNTEQLQLEIKTNQSFEQLKNQLKLTTPETTVDGRRALKYETGVYVLLDSNKILSLQRSIYPDEKSYLDYILSTFKCTQ